MYDTSSLTILQPNVFRRKEVKSRVSEWEREREGEAEREREREKCLPWDWQEGGCKEIGKQTEDFGGWK